MKRTEERKLYGEIKKKLAPIIKAHGLMLVARIVNKMKSTEKELKIARRRLAQAQADIKRLG